MDVRKKAVVAGHICLDIIPQFDLNVPIDLKSTFLPGSLTKVGPAIFSTGGAVSNTGLLLFKLGIDTNLVAKTGDDLFGQEIHQIVSRYGVHLANGINVDPSVSTSYTVILSPPGVDRIFLHSPGANELFSSADIPQELLSLGDLFHFGYPPMMRRIYSEDGKELVKIFRKAKQAGITTSLDLCMPDLKGESGSVDWAGILIRTLPFVDIFVPSLEEILFMLDKPNFQELADSKDVSEFIDKHPDILPNLGNLLMEMGPRIVLIKNGRCGAYLRSSNPSVFEDFGRARPQDPTSWFDRELWAPCFQVNVVGTTGSGDSTIAGFLSAFLRGLEPEASLRSAVAVGAFNVEAQDGLSGVPSWADVQNRIKNGWDRLIVCSLPEYWQWSEIEGIWFGASDKSIIEDPQG